MASSSAFGINELPETTGTTIMAVVFNGGVIIAADSRTSAGTRVANRISDKLTRITDKIYCCRSGSAADTQAIADIVSYSLSFEENRTGEDALVSEAASEFHRYLYEWRNSVKAGIIVAGWDGHKGGQVYSLPRSGSKIREAVTLGGSGAKYIYGFVREHFQPQMEKEECIGFVVCAIKYSIRFDGSSGGVICVGIITKDGIERRVFYKSELGKPIEAGN